VTLLADIEPVSANAVPSRVLAAIAANAAALDAAPAFPHEAFAALGDAGALAPPPASRAAEWTAVRAVARADGSVGRLYEGHLNAAERLAVAAPEPFRATELEAVARGELWLGVWGADPAPGEGEPARLVRSGSGWVLDGVKVFCSGAGGLHRALVTSRHPDGGAPRLAYVNLEHAGVEVDRAWYRAGGMRASESHRVVFDRAPVTALLGSAGELTREPWFSRDAIRTAAAWAGIADAAADAALHDLSTKPELDDLRALAAGRIVTARATIDRWFEYAGAADPEADLRAVAIQLRAAVVDAGATILHAAGQACGSRPFATGGVLDRARRDFELFVLQHRLDPLIVRMGRNTVEALP
jgi:alkylation response protein AidB-like acyl-CoA dehydrogenase